VCVVVVAVVMCVLTLFRVSLYVVTLLLCVGVAVVSLVTVVFIVSVLLFGLLCVVLSMLLLVLDIVVGVSHCGVVVADAASGCVGEVGYDGVVDGDVMCNVDIVVV